MTFKQILHASCAIVISATTATAQVPSYVPTDGLVGWWPFNGNANDESGNGNDGVVNGATLTEDRNGAPNAAYSFDGNSYIQKENWNSILGDQEFTINFWLLYQPSLGWIVSFGQPQTSNGFHIGTRVNEGQLYSAFWSFSYDFNTYPTYTLSDNWEMITVEYVQDSVRQFANGVLQTSLSSSYMNEDITAGSLNFGKQIGNFQEYFSGSMDDIAIYNRALTPQEIQNLYNASTETVDTGNGAAPLPQGIPYQAAARDAQGQSLVNAAVNVRFTLHEGAADGAASYAETHALTTNGVGLFNTVFGNGTPEQSAFDSINWAATTKFLQVEIDLGEGYVDMGTTQLLSVPYALRSDEAARVKNAGLPVFNDNAAALAGGLVAGEMYRTSAGVLMIAY
jgi:hypothetical protein